MEKSLTADARQSDEESGASETLQQKAETLLTADAQSQADQTSLRSDTAKGKSSVLWIFLGTGSVAAVAGVGAVSLLHAKAK